MYWTDYGTDKIQRANLNGTDVEDLVTTELPVPLGIALDVAGGKMYWTGTDDGAGKICRANLDGTGVEDLIAIGTSYLYCFDAIALDVAGGKMYWTECSYPAPKIQRANLNGQKLKIW